MTALSAITASKKATITSITMDDKAVAAYAKKLRAMPLKDLRAECADIQLSTATSTVKLAYLYVEFQRRGLDDFSEFPVTYLSRLTAIANGTLLPEAYPYLLNSTVTSALTQLSLPEQRKLLKTGHLTVQRTPTSSEKVPLKDLTPIDVQRAIDGIAKVVRPVKHQKALAAPTRLPQRNCVTLAFNVTDFDALRRNAAQRGMGIHALVMTAIRDAGLLT